MKPDCAYYQDCGRPDGGCCAHPQPPFKTRKPSFGTCNRCDENKQKGQPIAALTINSLTAEQAAEAKRNQDKITRGLWIELHTRAAGRRGEIDVRAELAWLVGWSRRVPCGDCKAHWFTWWDGRPADFATPSRYFAWTVESHNAVNALLGKPRMTLADALRLYGAPPAWANELEAELRTAIEAGSSDK
jgi:hypothetical protein